MNAPVFVFDPTRLRGLYDEVRALRAEVDASLGPDDLAHLKKIEGWGRIATTVGLATAWIAPNPLSAVALSLGRSTRWLLMHHCGHRGYDKVPGVEARYTSEVFAQGPRRWRDWPDWMLPAAWNYEHNILHHHHTGERRDPDLIERNVAWLNRPEVPRALRWALLGALGFTWKASYYAPNTLRVWLHRHDPKGARPSTTRAQRVKMLLRESYGPYIARRFVGLPLAYLPLGPWAMFSALCNSVMGEALSNFHTFFVVGPNHTGDDLYRFDDRPQSKDEYLARQIIGSVNYRTGGDLNDYAHLWLNYQIEHHVFPDIPMLKYRQVQPKVRALCEKYGLPYVQAPVWQRFRKMAEVFVGSQTMRRMTRVGDAAAAAAVDLSAVQA
ncbi:MAG: fatty acid desaturase [Myxococcales bacterium]|nr:fatty acid desaturase [Myxococcales bacterium]